MTSRSCHGFVILLLYAQSLLFNGFNADAASENVHMFVNDSGAAVGDECVPLRVLNEPIVETNVGLVCVHMSTVDEGPESLTVTYNTTGSDYVLDSMHVHYGHDLKSVPHKADNAAMPDPSKFEFQNDADSEQVVFQLDPRGFMTCPSSSARWKKYFVAHALVHLKGDDQNLVDVYGFEGTLYNYNDVETGQQEYYSYFQMDVACRPANNATISEMPSNITFPLAPSLLISPSMAPYTLAPTTSLPTFVPGSPTMMPTPVTPAPTPAATTIPPKPMVPIAVTSNATSAVEAVDLVLGVSFTVITETSQAVHKLPPGVLQTSFAGFALGVLEEMNVAPLPANVTIDHHGRRLRLSVQYDNSSLLVYQFLVNLDCLNDDEAEATFKTSSAHPPPTNSQCHRAYARLAVRTVDEDPARVCETLRQGMQAGFQQGRLERIHRLHHPDSPVQLKPGNVEYCVPVLEFQVPDHGAADHWMDSNPLANLTAAEESDPKDDKKASMWIIVVIVVAVVLALLLGCYLYRRKLKKHKEREAKLSPHAQEEATLMA